MFFNSLEKRLKKSYAVLNPIAKQTIFPNGEAEYIFVGTLLDSAFRSHELTELMPIYASVSSFYKMSLGNCYTTYNYAKKKMPNFSNDEIYEMISISIITTSDNKNFKDNPLEQLKTMKGIVNSQIKTYIVISENMDVFETKDNDDIGKTNNPLLLAGRKGVEQYFNSLVSEITNSKINYNRTSSIYLTDDKTNLDYAIDEYSLVDVDSNKEVAKVWVNMYGIENTSLCLKGFKFLKDIE